MDRPIHPRSNAEPSLANWRATSVRTRTAIDAGSRGLLLQLLLNDGIGGPAIARQALVEHRVLPSPCESTNRHKHIGARDRCHLTTMSFNVADLAPPTTRHR